MLPTEGLLILSIALLPMCCTLSSTIPIEEDGEEITFHRRYRLPLYSQRKNGVNDTIVLNVRHYGATGDGVSDDTAAVQMAINSCPSLQTPPQWCEVLFPSPGIYSCFALQLLRNYTAVKVDSGAKVVMNNDIGAWPLSSNDDDGDVYSPLFKATGLQHLLFHGGGVIDGQGEPWWVRVKNGSLHDPPAMIQVFESSQIELKQLTLRDSPQDHFDCTQCSKVNVHHVSILAPWDSPNTDGLDFDSSEDIHIHNCVIENGDDEVSILSHFPRPSRNVLVENCNFRGGHGCSIGGHTEGGIYNVLVRNITFDHIRTSIRLKSYCKRNNPVPTFNVTYENIVIRHPRAAGIVINMFYEFNKGGCVPTKPLPGTLRNITIRNVDIDNVGSVFRGGGHVVCHKDRPCEGLVLQNITMHLDAHDWSESMPLWICHNAYGEELNLSPPAECLLPSA